MSLTTIEIAGRLVGEGQPCYVIAEAGVNHNGDPELARRLVDAAAASGADAVKFQTFDPAALAAGGAPTAAYQRAAGVAADDQRQMLAGLVLPRDTWAELYGRYDTTFYEPGRSGVSHDSHC